MYVLWKRKLLMRRFNCENINSIKKYKRKRKVGEKVQRWRKRG